MSGSIAERQGFNLVWALGVSVAFHALLMLLLWLFPVGREPVAKVTRAEPLTFTFEQPTAEESPFTRPEGDVPLETPQLQPPQAQAPDTLPEPSVRLTDDPAASAPTRPETPPPSPPVEPLQERAEPPETETREAAEPERSGAELFEGSDYRRDDPASQRRDAERQRESFDVDRALRDFGEALRQPPSRSDASREGDGSQDGVTIVDVPPVPSAGFGFGNLTFESRDYDWSDYARQIYIAIWRAWHNRLYATTEDFKRWAWSRRNVLLDHAAGIRFTIEGNGGVSGIVIEWESSCLPLDNSAVDALTEVILPPLPADFPRSRETVHATFHAEGDIRSMGQHLALLKRAGYF